MDEEITKILQEYLRSINCVKEDKCTICHRTPEQIKNDVFHSNKEPAKGFEDVTVDDVYLMSYKMTYPLCYSCYHNIKNNSKFINDLLQKSDDEVWGK